MSYRAVVGSWNVGSKFPDPSSGASFAQWLHADEFEAEVYAIGRQEIDMTAGALLREETEAGNIWKERMTEFLQSLDAPYKLVR